MQKDYRSYQGELRALSGDDEGIIEGYAAVWNTVDSYNSTFQRGAFTKTLQERGRRVKILWDHKEEVIGRPIEIKEDDHGLFVRAQLVLGVPKAREVFELVKAGAIDTFSFGFRTVKDKWVNGVRTITEVMLMEVSPVIFEANSSAVITGVRNMDNEKRDQDYKSTYEGYELHRRGDLIMSSLYRTLDDIWYSELSGEDIRSKVGEALSSFSQMYSAYTDELVGMQQRSVANNPIKLAIRKHLSDNNLTADQMAASSSFTVDEIRSLLDGKSTVDQSKVQDLPEEVQKAVKAERANKVEILCDELRGQLDFAEVARIRGLLPKDEPEFASTIVQQLAEFRATLK